LINACTDIGFGLGVLVDLGVGVALGRAGLTGDAGDDVDARLGPGDVVCLLGSIVGSLALQATMSSATGTTPSRFM
jgi:hypothetical protein